MLPQIDEGVALPRKAEQAMMARMDALDRAQQQQSAAFAEFASALSGALTALSNVVTTMQSQSTQDAKELKEIARIERDRDLENAMMDNFAQLSTQVSSDRAEVLGKLDAVRGVVEAVEQREAPNFIPLFNEMKNAIEGTTAALSGVSVTADLKLARIESLIADIRSDMADLRTRVEALEADEGPPNYNDSFLAIKQEIATLSYNYERQNTATVDVHRTMTELLNEVNTSVDAKVDALEQIVRSGSQSNLAQFNELRNLVANNQAVAAKQESMLEAVVSSVAALSEAVEALAVFVRPSEVGENDDTKAIGDI